MVLPCSDKISRVPSYSRPFVLFTCTGLSPSMAKLSILFQFLHKWHWPDPRSLVTTNGVSVDFLSSGYLDISVHQVRFSNLWIQLEILIKSGFPHSDILGSKLIGSYPRLIAAYHVLRRLLTPRHPPNALYCFLKLVICRIKSIETDTIQHALLI